MSFVFMLLIKYDTSWRVGWWCTFLRVILLYHKVWFSVNTSFKWQQIQLSGKSCNRVDSNVMLTLFSHLYEIVPASESIYVIKRVFMCLPKLWVFQQSTQLIRVKLWFVPYVTMVGGMLFDSVDFVMDSKVTNNNWCF